MRVAIVGAGFVGLTTAFRLAEKGISVDIYESSSGVGGLASGFKKPEWDWPVEKFYHHIFTNDKEIVRLAKDVGFFPIYLKPSTTLYYKDENLPFDSLFSFLGFPHLSLIEKLRMGITLGFLKFSPWWKPLERLTADSFLKLTMGSGFNAIWKPLLVGKFGPFANIVNAAWFWARIQKRTSCLGYFNKGFQGLADQILKKIEKNGGQMHFETPVSKIFSEKKKLAIKALGKKIIYDRVIITTPTTVFLKLVSGLPFDYRRRLKRLETVDSLVVVFALKKRVFKSAYWINVIDKGFPFLVVVEHTNMVDSKYYGGQHLVYLGAYLPRQHRYFRLTDSEVVKLAEKQLRNMSDNFSKDEIIESFVFQAQEAQPVMPINYSLDLPPIETPIPNLYLGNMSMIYPWDRGTNYAVSIGERIADLILKS